MWRKIQQTMFICVCKLQTPKIQPLFVQQIVTLASGASYDLSDGQEKIEDHMLDFVKIDVFEFDISFYIDIFSVAFCKFRFQIHL